MTDWPERSARRMRWTDWETVLARRAARSLRSSSLISLCAAVTVLKGRLKGRSWEAIRSKLWRERKKLEKGGDRE